jgi:hypothetical protein
MIERRQDKQQERKDKKRTRKKTDWNRLIEKFQRDDRYQTNHVTLRDRRERKRDWKRDRKS